MKSFTASLPGPAAFEDSRRQPFDCPFQEVRVRFPAQSFRDHLPQIVIISKNAHDPFNGLISVALIRLIHSSSSLQAHRFSCSDTSLNADSVFLSGFGLQFELDHDKIPHAEQAAERTERFAPEVGLPEHEGSAYPQPGIRGLDRYGDQELFPRILGTPHIFAVYRENRDRLITVLINCMAYIDLNPCRAGIVKKPEYYRWYSLGYHAQTGNRDGFLSTDFGLREFAVKGKEARLAHYRRFVYEKGGLLQEPTHLKQGLELSNVDRFRYRTRYFTDSGIIGTKEFVSRVYQDFKGYFASTHEKRPKPVKGLEGVYSLKRLSESIA